jgi:hypothetical protein
MSERASGHQKTDGGTDHSIKPSLKIYVQGEIEIARNTSIQGAAVYFILRSKARDKGFRSMYKVNSSSLYYWGRSK